jgi:pyruvate dehydrogenase E1 component alpha subunit
MPAEIVDGNDVFAVYEATERALAHIRAGRGPYLIECKTFRMTGHSAHDGAHYVPKELFEEWKRRDPIARLEQQMLENGWAERAELEAGRAAILREIDEAVAWAEAQPHPDPSTLEDGVYESR